MTVQPIGGEMPHWSDLDGTHGPAAAGGAASRALLGAAAGRVLVAGPHDPELIAALTVPGPTILVRGTADASLLSARFPGATICCGSLAKLAAAPAYDTVIALDGLDRLGSPETADLTREETLDRLLGLLRPGGRLMLAVENPFGLHRLLALPPAPADTEWVGPDDSWPVSPGRLRGRLAEAGVPVVREYAAYPGFRTPTALLAAEVLTDPALRGFLEATLTAVARPSPELLADPARLVTGAVRHELAAALAPAWILLAGDLPAGPAALIAPPGVESGRPGARAEPVVRDAGGRWTLGDRPLPLGRTLEDLVVAAGQRRDLPAVRDLLTAWQSGPAAGVPAGQVVVDAGGGHHGLVPAGEPVEALRRLAATLIGAGLTHLWPSPAGEAALTALLAGMTGRELDPRDVPAAGPGVPRPDVGTVRELTMARDRLERELADARARHEFYERQIAYRDEELKRVRKINAVLSATTPGKAVLGGLKAGRRAFRAVTRRGR
ncbi:hypothetical protein ACQP2F_25465 [Actinoplanes sp. CA-030573]|uniref:hypothetical protein n=1 Tax=Actinoplanes sp. CA-030573 TaxID=3239898 RepID=UPI003D8A50AC